MIMVVTVLGAPEFGTLISSELDLEAQRQARVRSADKSACVGHDVTRVIELVPAARPRNHIFDRRAEGLLDRFGGRKPCSEQALDFAF